MKDLEKYLDNILKTKSYNELTEDELRIIKEEFGGERGFVQFKNLVMAASANDLSPNRNVKQKLDEAVELMYPSLWQRLVNVQVPAYAAVPAMILLMLFAYWIKQPETQIIEKQQIVQADPIIDTVFVETEADTVFIENIRRVEVPVYITLNEEKVKPKKEEDEVFEGSNLTQQSDLMDLLTSAP